MATMCRVQSVRDCDGGNGGGARVALAPAGEVKALKAQCNSLADAAQAEKFELLSAKQENDRLQDQIVQVS